MSPSRYSWDDLSDDEKKILDFLYGELRHTNKNQIDSRLLAIEIDLPKDAVNVAVERLKLARLVTTKTYTGALVVFSSPAGICIAWASSNPQDFEDTRAALQRELSSRTSPVRIGDLVQLTGVPVGVVFSLASWWKQRGLVEMDDRYPLEQSMVALRD